MEISLLLYGNRQYSLPSQKICFSFRNTANTFFKQCIKFFRVSPATGVFNFKSPKLFILNAKF